MTRLYGRALVGQRCHFAAPNGHWKTWTMLSAIRIDGPIQKATLVFEGAVNGEVFRTYVEECLAPTLRPGDVVVMDNLASHKVSGVREAIESRQATICYLPPYSPDLNPIEKMWAKVKSLIRREAARTTRTLLKAITKALRAVTNDECANYFRSCGYARDDR